MNQREVPFPLLVVNENLGHAAIGLALPGPSRTLSAVPFQKWHSVSHWTRYVPGPEMAA